MAQGRPGRPPLAAKREQFERLIAWDVGSAEACRIVAEKVSFRALPRSGG
jgi:hypothetical protein